MSRPIITKGKTGIGNFGLGIMPDGTPDTLRVLIKPDGFHFVPSDFDDLVLPRIVFDTPNGSRYDLSFNDAGELLINGNKLVASTNQEDETISGNKTYTGMMKLEGGLQFSDNNKTYSISFDDDGALLINGVKHTAPTNQGNETIKGDKTYEGQTKLSGGLQLLSPNGTVFNVKVDDVGELTTEKEVTNA